MDANSKASADSANPKYRALVVDDEAALAEVVASYLKREHFEVTQCHSGTDAVTLAREVDPDVVVLDLGLPGLDGVEVCRQLRRPRAVGASTSRVDRCLSTRSQLP
jgi:DNA-binding response OmpR family regulator